MSLSPDKYSLPELNSHYLMINLSYLIEFIQTYRYGTRKSQKLR